MEASWYRLIRIPGTNDCGWRPGIDWIVFYRASILKFTPIEAGRQQPHRPLSHRNEKLLSSLIHNGNRRRRFVRFSLFFHLPIFSSEVSEPEYALPFCNIVVCISQFSATPACHKIRYHPILGSGKLFRSVLNYKCCQGGSTVGCWDQHVRDGARRRLRTSVGSVGSQNESAFTSKQTSSGVFRWLQVTLDSITRLKTD